VLAKRAWVLLFIGIAVFYLWGLGLLPLIGPDEPRYAEVAREMFVRRDLITPTLGGHPWFEKPALLYWLMMASYRVFGVSEFAARFGSAVCGLATAAFIYWIGKSVTDAAEDREANADLGRVSAFIWLSALGAIVFSRGASFDINLTATITGALAFFLNYETHRQGRPADRSRQSSLNLNASLAAFYFFAGCSLLAKGLVGFVIIFGVLGVYYLVQREWPGRPFLFSLIWGIPLAVAVAAVWYGPMIKLHGWTFIDQFIVQHHFARFTSNKYHHPGPIYFYVPAVVTLSLPWLGFLVASFVAMQKRWRSAAPLDRLRVFALVWLLIPVLFFSFSGSKLVSYALPVLPAIALLAGERVVGLINQGRGAWVMRFTALALLAIAAGELWYARQGLSGLPVLIGLSALPLVIAGAIVLVRPRVTEVTVVVTGGALILSGIIALRLVVPAVTRTESVRDLITTAAARGLGGLRVVQLHTVERTAEFYAADRLDYGPDGEPLKLESVLQVVESAQRNGGAVLCFVPIQFQSQLTTYSRAQSEIIADNGRVALALVQPK
jgi:4-amino-4-deoxy-L-arabinose transferase-like glycosyltransferase